MIQGLTTAESRLNSDAQHLLQFVLADVIVQSLGTQSIVRAAARFVG